MIVLQTLKDFLIIEKKFSKNFFNLDGKSSHRACEAVLSFAKKRGLK